MHVLVCVCTGRARRCSQADERSSLAKLRPSITETWAKWGHPGRCRKYPLVSSNCSTWELLGFGREDGAGLTDARQIEELDVYVCVMEKQSFISRLRRCNFRDFSSQREKCSQPTPNAQKMILAGLDCERGVWWPGPHGGLRRARFFLLFLLSFPLQWPVLCIVYVMGLAEWLAGWLAGCPADVAVMGTASFRA